MAIIPRDAHEATGLDMIYFGGKYCRHVISQLHETVTDRATGLMWSKAGIIRSGKTLEEALERLGSWSFIEDGSFLTRRELELRNMILAGVLIAKAASLRKGSVGAHYRSDARTRGRGWKRHITFKRDGNG